MCIDWEAATSRLEKQAVKVKYRAEQLDGHMVKGWKRALDFNAESPKGVKAAMHEIRLRGSGSAPDLSAEQEQEIDDWIMERRAREVQVRVVQIKNYAKARYTLCQDNTTPFKGGCKWVNGFMERRNFSVRLATTNKPVTSIAMRLTQFHYRNRLVARFHSSNPTVIYNMDETSVTLDAPGTRTVERKGAKCVPIKTTGHQCDRVAVVICVSASGDMVTPLVIRPGGIRSRYFGKLIRETHGGVDMFVMECKKAWLNSAGMIQWVKDIYVPYVRSAQQNAIPETIFENVKTEFRRRIEQDTVLFMDNCSVHDSEQTTAALHGTDIQYEFFPPNCTPILQPCDQNVNHLFKLEYEQQWADWMESKGSKKDNVTRYGNPAAATPVEYMAWIGSALKRLDQKAIQDSWRMSCWGHGFTAFQLPDKLWARIVAFLLPVEGVEELERVEEQQQTDVVMDEKEEKAMAVIVVVVATVDAVTEATEQEVRARLQAERETLGAVQRIRKLYTACHDYSFPVKKRRRKAVGGVPMVGIATTSAPTKRRRLAAVSDVDTDVEEVEEKDDSNKENEDEPIVLAGPTARDVLREERYQILQGEVSESGSSRVLNKRVTSELWASRQPLQTLHNSASIQ